MARSPWDGTPVQMRQQVPSRSWYTRRRGTRGNARTAAEVASKWCHGTIGMLGQPQTPTQNRHESMGEVGIRAPRAHGIMRDAVAHRFDPAYTTQWSLPGNASEIRPIEAVRLGSRRRAVGARLRTKRVVRRNAS